MPLNFETTAFIPAPRADGSFPALLGSLTAAGKTPFLGPLHFPNVFYAQLSGTSGTVGCTCHFEYSQDGKTLAGKGGTITLTGTGVGATVIVDGDSDKTFEPFTPWKFARLVVDTITGTGTKVSGYQSLGSL